MKGKGLWSRNMARIFISFAHEEKEVAQAVQSLIYSKVRDVEVFLSSDQQQLYAGENWLTRIQQELKSANVVVLLLSPLSLSRPWINFEAGAAWLSNKTLIPVCYHGLVKNKLPKPYSDLQAIDLAPADLEGGSKYLIDSINHHLGKPPELSLLPPPGFKKPKASSPRLPDYVKLLVLWS